MEDWDEFDEELDEEWEEDVDVDFGFMDEL